MEWMHSQQDAGKGSLDPKTIIDTAELFQSYLEEGRGRESEGTEAGRLKAAKAWADWESYLIRFEPQDVDEDAYQSLAIACLEYHYFVNEGWLKGDGIQAVNEKLCAVRRVVCQFPLSTALKTLMARHSGNDAWLNIRPPLMPMNDADKEKLLRDFDAIGFQLPLAA